MFLLSVGGGKFYFAHYGKISCGRPIDGYHPTGGNSHAACEQKVWVYSSVSAGHRPVILTGREACSLADNHIRT